MSAPDLFASIKTHFMNFLQCGLFTTDSLEGWLCIFILGFFMWKLGKKAFQFFSWACAVIFLIQVFYWLSFTSLNDKIPFSNIFKYNVLESIANCFKNAKITQFLHSVNNYIKTTITSVWDFISNGELKNTIDGVLLR